MSTPASVTSILAWQKAHRGEVRYSETASTRLDFDANHLTAATDCSGMAIRMLKHFGGAALQAMLKNSTYTGNLCQAGQHITSNHDEAAAGRGMLPGDLIFFTWGGHNPAYDHVAIYAGNGRIWNHGGPGNGPLDWALADNVHAASEVMVRRYVNPTQGTVASTVGKVINKVKGPPKFPLRSGYFGPIRGPAESHGGAYADERPGVLLIQQQLIRKHMVPGVTVNDGSGWADGIYGEATVRAVMAWQRAELNKRKSKVINGCIGPLDWKDLLR